MILKQTLPGILQVNPEPTHAMLKTLAVYQNKYKFEYALKISISCINIPKTQQTNTTNSVFPINL